MKGLMPTPEEAEAFRREHALERFAAADRAYNRARRDMKDLQTARVEAALDALAAGWNQADLARRINMAESNFSRLLRQHEPRLMAVRLNPEEEG